MRADRGGSPKRRRGASEIVRYVGQGTKDQQVRGYQGSVLPALLVDEEAPKTLDLHYSGAIRGVPEIRDWSLLTSWALIFWVFCRLQDVGLRQRMPMQVPTLTWPPPVLWDVMEVRPKGPGPPLQIHCCACGSFQSHHTLSAMQLHSDTTLLRKYFAENDFFIVKELPPKFRWTASAPLLFRVFRGTSKAKLCFRGTDCLLDFGVGQATWFNY